MISINPDFIKPVDSTALKSFREKLKEYTKSLSSWAITLTEYPLLTVLRSPRYNVSAAYLREPLYPIEATSRMNLSCAVVGKSGILLGSKFGTLIDSHDLVFRPNTPPVRGFEDDVGSKVSVVNMNEATLQRCKNIKLCVNYFISVRAEAVMIRFIRPPTKYSVTLAEKLLSLNEKGYHFTVYIENPAWRTAFTAYTEKKEGLPLSVTTGTELIYQSVLRCAKISVFGFYPHSTSATGEHIPLYFYPNSEWKMAQFPHEVQPVMKWTHNYDYQHHMLEKWALKSLISLYSPLGPE